MRLTRLPIELATLIYLLTYLPYILITRLLSTTPNHELGRSLTGLQILPAVLIMAEVLLIGFIVLSGWWRAAPQLRLGRFSLPTPSRWTALSGVGAALLLFTVPLSLTFKGVSIPFIQLLMRGDVLVIAPLVDLLARRRVRWYSWVALAMVAVALVITVWSRGGLHLPPLAILTVVFYTIGYFIRLAVMTRVAKNGDPEALKGYFVGEQIVAMPLAILALWLISRSPLAAQGAQLNWGFVGVWASSAMPLLIVLAASFFCVSILAALILLNPRENTFCVPFERSASILAGILAAYVLAVAFRQPYPTPAEVVGIVLLVAAIALLSIAPRWRRSIPLPATSASGEA
jgi:drug/metabolite transporter (DMT)-like permease